MDTGYTKEYINTYLSMMTRYVALRGAYWMRFSVHLDEWVESTRVPTVDNNLTQWSLHLDHEHWAFPLTINDTRYHKGTA